jgi:WD40 repeat protein
MQVLTGHTDVAFCVRWSPDGSLLASSGHTTVRLWRFTTGESLAVLPGHTGHVLRVAWRPDGAIIAAASADMIVRLWDVRAAKPIVALGGHTDWVHGVTWSPGGTVLASCAPARGRAGGKHRPPLAPHVSR